jgi:Ricin-type beta-trefoil lectin domain
VQTYTCNATFAQQWNFDVFTIQGLGSTASGNKCLDVFARGTADGTPVDITSCNGTPAQTWVYSGGRVINTNSNKCLTAGPLGTQVTIRTYNGTASQLWLVRS